jgi:hypothetical protein
MSSHLTEKNSTMQRKCTSTGEVRILSRETRHVTMKRASSCTVGNNLSHNQCKGRGHRRLACMLYMSYESGGAPLLEKFHAIYLPLIGGVRRPMLSPPPRTARRATCASSRMATEASPSTLCIMPVHSCSKTCMAPASCKRPRCRSPWRVVCVCVRVRVHAHVHRW